MIRHKWHVARAGGAVRAQRADSGDRGGVGRAGDAERPFPRAAV